LRKVFENFNSSIHPPLELSLNSFSTIGVRARTCKIFIESIDRSILNAMVNGPYVPMHDVNGMSVVKSFDEMSEADNKRVQYDCVGYVRP